MGAIKEGDDPADYKYEWNPKVAIPVGIAGGTMAAFASATLFVGVIYYTIYKGQDIKRRYFRTQRPLFGKKKRRPLFGRPRPRQPLFGGRKR